MSLTPWLISPIAVYEIVKESVVQKANDATTKLNGYIHFYKK